jgi:streptogramin lyase
MKTQMMVATMLVLAPISAAFAAQTSGTITAISKNADTVTLSDGKTYVLPEGIEDTKLRVGEKVQLTYADKGGKAVVSHLVPQK